MEDLATRAAQVADRHPSSALPLPELCRLVRGSGVAVREDVLLAALERRPDRFRVIDPWLGPWSTLSAASRDRRGPRIRAASGGHTVAGAPWVVHLSRTRSWSPSPHGALLARLRESLIQLGWRVDESSAADLARWLGLVESGRRVHARLRRIEA